MSSSQTGIISFGRSQLGCRRQSQSCFLGKAAKIAKADISGIFSFLLEAAWKCSRADFQQPLLEKPKSEVWVIWEGVGGRVGEENFVFIGKKNLEKTAAAESGSQNGACQDFVLQGNPSTPGLYRVGAAQHPNSPSMSIFSILSHLLPLAPSLPLSQRDHLDLSTSRDLLRQQDGSSRIPLQIYGHLSAKYQLHDNGVV